MPKIVNNAVLIEWLETNARWSNHRASLLASTTAAMVSSSQDMFLQSPAGDRVRRSVVVTAKNLRSIERELRFVAQLCEREGARLRDVDSWVLQLVNAEAFDPVAKADLDRYRLDSKLWEYDHLPPPAVDDVPYVDVSLDADDEPAARVMFAPDGSLAVGSHVSRSGDPAQPQTLAAGLRAQAYVMDLDSMRAASTGLKRASTSCQDHQSAISRQFGQLPQGLTDRLRTRLESSRRASTLGLERSARRLNKQSVLLRTRANTPGLVDRPYNPDIPPIGPTAGDWIPPATFELKAPLAPSTEHFVGVAMVANRAMTRLLRRLPVIVGSLPPGWWKPIGETNDVPPRPVWGDDVPPQLLDALGLTVQTVTPPAATPVNPSQPEVCQPGSDDGKGVVGSVEKLQPARPGDSGFEIESPLACEGEMLPSDDMNHKGGAGDDVSANTAGENRQRPEGGSARPDTGLSDVVSDADALAEQTSDSAQPEPVAANSGSEGTRAAPGSAVEAAGLIASGGGASGGGASGGSYSGGSYSGGGDSAGADSNGGFGDGDSSGGGYDDTSTIDPDGSDSATEEPFVAAEDSDLSTSAEVSISSDPAVEFGSPSPDEASASADQTSPPEDSGKQAVIQREGRAESSLHASAVAGGAILTGSVAGGGAAIANKRARSRVTDWSSYVVKKGVLASAGQEGGRP